MNGALAFIWLSFGGYDSWIASIKRRNPVEGFLLGLFLGPIGCLVEAYRRDRSPEEVEAERTRRGELAEVKRSQAEQHRTIAREESRRRRREARARADAAGLRRAESFRRSADWFDRAVLKFGWFQALPEVAQPIVIGLLVALPLVVLMILAMKGR